MALDVIETAAPVGSMPAGLVANSSLTRSSLQTGELVLEGLDLGGETDQAPSDRFGDLITGVRQIIERASQLAVGVGHRVRQSFGGLGDLVPHDASYRVHEESAMDGTHEAAR
jgi:hypothetical protein